MQHIEGTFIGFGGLKLYYQGWYPSEPPQAMVVLVHGLGGHSGLFREAIEYLVPQGYEVYALDLRGHGRSPGQRGHINTWREFREDLHAFVQHLRTLRSCCPFILWGHSLGGTIALDYALRQGNHLHGLIASAPALGKVGISPKKIIVGRALSRIAPRFTLKLGIRENLAEDSASVRAYLEDPLRHEVASARLASEFFATVDWIYRNAEKLQIPLLLMHGADDQVTLPEGSRAFFQRVIYPDKEHREYPGSYHDIYIQVDYQEIFKDLENWLVQHFEGAGYCEPLSLLPIPVEY